MKAEQNNTFKQFLEGVEPGSREFVEDIHHYLTADSCTCDIKTAKSGYVVSYILQKTKRTLATIVCRKSGMKIRIYAENIRSYQDFLNTLPMKMKKDIDKASECKRLLNPNDCNPKCVMGYTFTMDGVRYQKCRHMAFMPALSEENNPFIRRFLEHELSYTIQR